MDENNVKILFIDEQHINTARRGVFTTQLNIYDGGFFATIVKAFSR